MTSRRELAARRSLLVARSVQQRSEAGLAVSGIGRALWPIDAAERLVGRAAAHPALAFTAIIAVVVVLRPGRILKMVAWAGSSALALRRIAGALRGA